MDGEDTGNMGVDNALHLLQNCFSSEVICGFPISLRTPPGHHAQFPLATNPIPNCSNPIFTHQFYTTNINSDSFDLSPSASATP
ncbi:unnamed protein product [Sphenostylis stenocarpa]|uniref:Uncharacterized protein n=1 Tax=Sphenostylis stenocarpa TaxID=92480 RepID=A0AA86RNY1_9FABA|nr:unnamed protein product [Sphenostylis stenocarpa]